MSALRGRPNRNPLPFCPSRKAAIGEVNDSGSNGLSKVNQTVILFATTGTLNEQRLECTLLDLLLHTSHISARWVLTVSTRGPLGWQTEWLQACAAALLTHFQHTSSKTRAVAVTVQCTSASVNGSGTKGLPDNGFTDVGGNKEGNTRPQAVTLL